MTSWSSFSSFGTYKMRYDSKCMQAKMYKRYDFDKTERWTFLRRYQCIHLSSNLLSWNFKRTLRASIWALLLSTCLRTRSTGRVWWLRREESVLTLKWRHFLLKSAQLRIECQRNLIAYCGTTFWRVSGRAGHADFNTPRPQQGGGGKYD
jgi:hypothetical protein